MVVEFCTSIDRSASHVTKKLEYMLQNMPVQQSFDIENWVTRLAMDVVGQVAFGVDLKVLEEPQVERSDEQGEFVIKNPIHCHASGNKMTLRDAFKTVLDRMIPRTILPKFLWWIIELNNGKEEGAGIFS